MFFFLVYFCCCDVSNTQKKEGFNQISVGSPEAIVVVVCIYGLGRLMDKELARFVTRLPKVRGM